MSDQDELDFEFGEIFRQKFGYTAYSAAFRRKNGYAPSSPYSDENIYDSKQHSILGPATKNAQENISSLLKVIGNKKLECVSI
jgi:hypothetical protein